MVNVQEKDTEQRILNAAKKIFLEKGRDGARMQEIANEAGINKSLLHYYFRSKDKLFEAIFKLEFKKFIPDVNSILRGDIPFEAKIRKVVDKYFQLLKGNPFLPLFILDEISRNPEAIPISMIQDFADHDLARELMESAAKEGYLFKDDPRHYIINLVGLSVMPFVGRNAFVKILFGNDNKAYDVFLESRSKLVSDILLKQLKNED